MDTGKINKDITINTEFESKISRRFVVYITDQFNKQLIPAFVVKSTTIPSFTTNWRGKKIWKRLIIHTYDPIVPSTTIAIYKALQNKSKWNINIQILGPVGDIVEQYNIKNAKLVSANFPSYDWNNDEISMTSIELQFKYTNITVN